ncbi:MAG: ABC transporter ATP-binding protein/permease [Actinomycetota bacterium]|nr:ABC transporter ATP-binding protein/permease [Actinomycetota bacterium]
MNTNQNSDTPAAPEPERAPAGDRVPVWEPSGELGLIGVDDLALPYWAEVDQSVAESSTWMLVRSVPRVVAAVVAQAWRIAPRLTALAGLLQLASGVASAFGLLATAGVLTQLLEAGAHPEQVVRALPALAWVVASYAARGLLETATGAVEGQLAPLVEQAAQDHLHAALAEVELIAFDDPDFTELVNKGTQALSHLRSAASSIGDLLAALVALAAAVVTAGLLHPLLAPVVFLPAIPRAWSSIRTARQSYLWFLAMTSRARRLGVVGGMLTSRVDAAEIRAFTAGPLLLAEHRHLNASLTADAIAVERRNATIRLLGRTVAGIGTGLAYLQLGALIYTGSLPLAVAGAAALAMRTAAAAVANSVYTSNRLYELSFHLALYKRCLTDATTRARHPPPTPDRDTATSPDQPNAEPATQPNPGPRRSSAESDIRNVAETEAGARRGTTSVAASPRWPGSGLTAHGPRVVELRGVSFTYPGQDQPAVREVDLSLRAGQVTALVGENGSGKSTVARLIAGLYLPDTGTITWDSIDIATIDPNHLLNQVAIVGQNPTQWPMTAANNIRIGRLQRPDPDGARLADAATRADAHTVADDLPQRWDTMLSPRFQGGRDLSGGQWQRISVARALYRDAPLVIADEPTAALDARAEHAVFTTLRALPTTTRHPAPPPTPDNQGPTNHADQAGRISVLITHRLANVRNAHHIVVLNAGRVTATGTHDQLIDTPGDYRDLYQLQARAYQTGS